MKMLKVIEKRRSVRDYKERELDARDLELVMEYMGDLPQVVAGVTVKARLMEGTQVFERLDGVVGYNGVMIKAPHYLVLSANGADHYLTAGGYAGEWLVLNVTKHDIATCWVSTNNQEAQVHRLLELPVEEAVVGIIALGYAKGEQRVSNIFKRQGADNSSKLMSYQHVDTEYLEAPVSGRLSIEEIVYMKTWGKGAAIEELEVMGFAEVFYYMRLAPSSANKQPWRFVVDKDRFVLVMSKDDGYDDDHLAKLEAGIAMLYFEVAMHDAGFPGGWSYGSVTNAYGIPESHFVAGLYQFQ